jgi:CPA2 family monovalent cation:H+ antiporter-2
MHGSHDFLYNLAIVLGVAAVTTVVFQRLRQPVVFGYMLAGLIIGPHVPIPLVVDEATVHTLSELGVVLLMFSLGLEFSVRRLMQTGGSVVIVAVLQSSLMLWLGYETARLLGWPALAGLFAGAAISISSTTIVAKTLPEQRTDPRVRELVFGILIVQDLIAIVLLALLTPAGSPGAPTVSVGLTMFRLLAILAGLLALGMLVLPPLMRFVVGVRSPEITLVFGIGFCFSTAILVREIGYSVALGAFLAGSLVAETGEGNRVEQLVAPVRDMFVAVFFVSVGMMIEPALVARHWIEVVGGTLLVIFGMVGSVSIATFLTGAGIRTAVRTGMCLGQIGEFSYIIAGVGLANGATPPSLYPAVIAVSAITALTTPWLMRSADPVAAWIDGNLPRRLQTFAALYGTWIESLRNRPETSADRMRLRRAGRALLVDAGVIVALSIGASLTVDPIASRWVAGTHWTLGPTRALVAAAAVLLSTPFLLGIVRNARVFGETLSRRAFVEPEGGELDRAAAPRRALVMAVQLTTVLVVAAPLLAVTQPFLPPFAGIGILFAGALVVAFIVWRGAADLQGHVRAAAEGIAAALGRRAQPSGSDDAEGALRRAYELLPGLGDPVPFRIDEGSPYAGRRLAEIGLRGKTGATVIAISRSGDVVLVPDGHMVLVAGDILALAGTRESIEAAGRLLAAASP